MVLDRKTGYGLSSGNYVGYSADLASVTDYYPGGMAMPGRSMSVYNYRFGNQKQEGDDEIYGDGAIYAFTERMEDARINRFWTVDPLHSTYPWNSDYAFSENRLIDGIDLEGLEFVGAIMYMHARSRGQSQLKNNNQNTVENKKTSASSSLGTTGVVVGSVDQAYGFWQEDYNFLTYTTTCGETRPIFRQNGQVRSLQAAKKLSLNNKIQTTGLGLNLLSLGLGFANLADQYQSAGSIDAVDAAEFGVGTVGTVANGLSYFGLGGAAAGAVGTATGFIGIGIQSGKTWYQLYKGMEDLELESKITDDPGEIQSNQMDRINGVVNEGDEYGGR